METKTQHDEAQIRAKFNSLQMMFSEPSMEFFEKTFTRDCDYITFQGQHLKGILENFMAHKKISALWIFKGAKLSGEIMSIKFLNEDVAVVVAKGAIKFRFQKKVSASRLSISTTVFTKVHGIWKISCFQNTRIRTESLLSRLFK